MIKRFLVLGLLFLLTGIQVFCLEALNFNGFIADNANVITPRNEIILNQMLLELQTKTKADVAVVTLNSLEGYPVEDVSLEIARKYKLGDKKLNNGALVLIVPNDRKARIEIGYGLEGIINDSKAGRILDDYMIPYFKENAYETGIMQGTAALAYSIAEEYGVKLSFEKPQQPENNNDADVLFIIIIIMLFILLNRGGGGGIFFGPSGGFGGGRGSGIRFGGGGGFGGGGASRGW